MFANQDLRGANFAGADLKEANFNGADISGARFCGANLQGATFIGAQARATDFTGANMEDATFNRAYLRRALFINTNLRDACFHQTILGQADMHGATIIGVTGTGDTIMTLHLGEYHVVICNGVVAVGCRQHTIQEWSTMTTADLRKMDGKRAVAFFSSPSAELILNLAKEQYV